MVSATALFGAGAVLFAGSLAAAIATQAEAKPLGRPYYSYTTKSYATPANGQSYTAQVKAQARTAPARALGDRVAQASQSYTAYQGAADAARAAPAPQAQYAASTRYATPYTDAYRAQTAPAQNKLAPTMVFFSSPMRGFSINSRFGLRTLGKRTRPHEGVDFAAPMGSPVLCAAQGRVVRIGSSPTYGRYVEVEHPNGVTSFYAHLSAVNVRTGASLGAGDTLGKVGSTGRSTGPHLHFEIRRNGRQLDPTGFLGRQFPSQFQVYRIAHGAGGGVPGIRGVAAAE